jgi:membrane protease YdiL (CAAX protease family)
MGAAGSAALFGVWHIRPTLDGLAANGLAQRPATRAAAVLGACLSTAATGALFSALRVRSGSLLAPVLLHLTANSLGTVAAAVAHRRASPPGTRR